MNSMKVLRLALSVAIAVGCAARADALGPESKQLARAKDYIADEQWPRAIDALKAAIADRAETRRDEALYWLAHSLHQSGDSAEAIEVISRLERDYPASMWVKPARSLRIEIAVRLNRSDVLWWTALPPAAAAFPAPPLAKSPLKNGTSSEKQPPAASPKLPPAPPPPRVWLDPDSTSSDLDLQILALNGLMKTEADKVIPILGQIAFQTDKPGQAGQVLFMLAQSERPEARDVVVRVAKTGPEPARIAAIKAWGRFGGPQASKDLLQVYPTAIAPVKLQIVKSLGERLEKGALVQIVTSEKEAQLRSVAITCLAQAGGAEQLAAMYKTLGTQGRRSVIVGLFAARADGELVRIAELESDTMLRDTAIERLRLLGTPRAKEYLQKVSEKR